MQWPAYGHAIPASEESGGPSMSGGSSSDHVAPDRDTPVAPLTASQLDVEVQLSDQNAGLSAGRVAMAPSLQVAPVSVTSMGAAVSLFTSPTLPIARQLDSPAHEMPESWDWVVDGTEGSCDTVVDPPMICSIIPTRRPPGEEARFQTPTASHWDGAQHETPAGWRLLPNGGATSSKDHEPALNVSMSASPLDSTPTAVQSVASAQETDDTSATEDEYGRESSVQTPSLSTSAKGVWGSPELPTATHVDATQDTDANCGSDKAYSPGVGSTTVVHVVPFHVIASNSFAV
jgi:hypothetical protein